MTPLEKFLGTHISNLPQAKHYSTARRVEEGPHPCVMCKEQAVKAFRLDWPPPLEHPGYWVDTCAEHGLELRLFADQENLDKGL